MSSVKPTAEDIAAAQPQWVSPALTRWYGEEGMRQNIGPDAEELAEGLFDDEYGAMIRDLVEQIPVQDPLLWADRTVDLGDGHWAITSIRFRNRDLSRPFVYVLACSAPPTAETLHRLAECVMPVYEAFSPLCFRVLAPGPSGPFDPASSTPDLGLAIDQRFLAGRVEELNAAPRRTAFSEVSLEPITAAEAAQYVSEMHERLRAANPDQHYWASPATAEELQQPEEERLLFTVRTAEPIGVVAAKRDDSYGMTGFCVQEITVDEEFRGRGLGTASLHHLCRKLGEVAAAGDVLWGTIHADNLPSLNNARSVGREEVATYMWVTPAGFPGMPA